MLWAQVGILLHYGGATSNNDLTAKSERYTRFYSAVGAEAMMQFSSRWVGCIGVMGGSFISQDRNTSFSISWSQTRWQYIRAGLHFLLLRTAFSPVIQGGLGFLNFSVRDQSGKNILPSTAPTQTLTLYGGVGLQWAFSPYAALRVSYLRIPTGTDYIEGVSQGKKDRIEAIIGTLQLRWSFTQKSRFE